LLMILKLLVSSADDTQPQELLAEAASKAVTTMQTEANQLKKVASSLTFDHVEAQLLLLNGIRDVANALGLWLISLMPLKLFGRTLKKLLRNSNLLLKPPQLDKAKATPEKLLQVTQAIALASSKTVTADTKLFMISKAVAQNFTQTKEQTEKCRVMACCKECTIAYKALLQFLHHIVLKADDSSIHVKLPSFTREVASAVSDIVKVTSELKRSWFH
uniref:Uncharacterized protein n=1 Tax=Amphimedon queenslandica TaxID=400682 RepID=A0A1X7USL6_AMPQE